MGARAATCVCVCVRAIVLLCYCATCQATAAAIVPRVRPRRLLPVPLRQPGAAQPAAGDVPRVPQPRLGPSRQPQQTNELSQTPPKKPSRGDACSVQSGLALFKSHRSSIDHSIAAVRAVTSKQPVGHGRGQRGLNPPQASPSPSPSQAKPTTLLSLRGRPRATAASCSCCPSCSKPSRSRRATTRPCCFYRTACCTG